VSRWLWGIGAVLAVGATMAFSLQPPSGLPLALEVPMEASAAFASDGAGRADLMVARASRPDHEAAGTATRTVPRRPAAPAISIGSNQQVYIDRDRAAARMQPLSWSSCLYAVALANARRMAAQGHISHTSGPWADLACHLGVQGGENVGWWSGGVDDARLNSMFMASPDHRANIMGPYHFVATAWAVAPNGYAYIAVEFA
jgi:uncharacterized protein YkwD